MAFDEHFYKRLKEKVNELGFSESEIGPLIADLNDMAEACSDYLEIIQRFLVLDADNKDELLDVLIEMQLTLEHLRFHIKSSLPLIKKLINKM